MVTHWLRSSVAFVVAAASGLGTAQTQTITAPAARGPVLTQAGPGFVTGTTATSQIVMIPGSAVSGTLVNNGNGTSSLLVPGKPPEAIPTPR